MALTPTHPSIHPATLFFCYLTQVLFEAIVQNFQLPGSIANAQLSYRNLETGLVFF